MTDMLWLERHVAIREACEIKAERDYFDARQYITKNEQATMLFQAGFRRGFDAGRDNYNELAAQQQAEPVTNEGPSLLMVATNRIAAAKAELDALKAENFALAAGQCIVSNGLIGDGGGTLHCQMQMQRDRLRALLAKCRDAILEDCPPGKWVVLILQIEGETREQA